MARTGHAPKRVREKGRGIEALADKQRPRQCSWKKERTIKRGERRSHATQPGKVPGRENAPCLVVWCRLA